MFPFTVCSTSLCPCTEQSKQAATHWEHCGCTGQRHLVAILESLLSIKCSCPIKDCKCTLYIDTMVSTLFSVAKDGTQGFIYTEKMLYY